VRVNQKKKNDVSPFLPVHPRLFFCLRQLIRLLCDHPQTLQDAKYSLLQAVVNTDRGLASSPEERSLIEELMVCYGLSHFCVSFGDFDWFC
jgi:hypothetical protein